MNAENLFCLGRATLQESEYPGSELHITYLIVREAHPEYLNVKIMLEEAKNRGRATFLTPLPQTKLDINEYFNRLGFLEHLNFKQLGLGTYIFLLDVKGDRERMTVVNTNSETFAKIQQFGVDTISWPEPALPG